MQSGLLCAPHGLTHTDPLVGGAASVTRGVPSPTLLVHQVVPEGRAQGELVVSAPPSEQGKKKQRNKRPPKSVEKPASRYKKRKKEEEEQARNLVCSSTDTLMTQLKQV